MRQIASKITLGDYYNPYAAEQHRERDEREGRLHRPPLLRIVVRAHRRVGHRTIYKVQLIIRDIIRDNARGK